MWYGIAADLMVAIHVAYVAYVVLGQLAIVLAAPMKWQWARNPWFRFTHLAAIGIVAYEAIYSLRCPLTVWEEQLRALAGQGFNGSETFMGRILHDILFVENMPEIAFTIGYCGMALLVLQGVIMYPPRWFRLGKKKAVEVTPSPVAPTAEPKTEAALTDTKEQAPVAVSA